jgi:hypothetical protein
MKIVDRVAVDRPAQVARNLILLLRKTALENDSFTRFGSALRRGKTWTKFDLLDEG